MAPALNLDMGGSHQGFLESLEGQSDTNHTKKLYRHCQKAKYYELQGQIKLLFFLRCPELSMTYLGINCFCA